MTEVVIRDVNIVVSAGHTEYMPARTEGVIVEWVWEGLPEDVDTDVASEELYDVCCRRFVEDTGITLDQMGDFDPMWESVARFRGPRDRVIAALYSLIREISVSPTGDDSVFDYWPSGVRMAFAMDQKLEAGRAERIEQIVRRTLADPTLEPFADELLPKLGLTAS